jgi:HEAT repeat protein
MWAALAALLLAWYAGRRLILVGRLGDRRMIAEGPLPSVLQDLLERAGVRRRIRLTTSATISSPVALGAGEICLPGAALVELEPEQQRAMLAHELAHLVRRDPQWLGLACLVERAFFFQPLNRLARRRMQQSAEYLADEWAAGRSGRVPLARCLVKVAEWIQASPLGVPVAGMAEERSELSARVARLLEAGAAGRGLPRWAGGMLAVALLAAVVAFAPGAGGMPTVAAVIPTDEMPALMMEDDSFDPKAGQSSAEGPSARPKPEPAPETVAPGGGGKVEEDTTVVRALIARLRDDDAGVRRAAAEALGKIGNPLAIPDLVRTLDDPEPEVRRAALDALSNFEKGVPPAPIRRLLASEDADMRQQAASMLGDMRDRESITPLSRLVRDPDPNVRQQALDALSNIGDDAAGPAVLGALTDANADVRHTAFHTLEHLKVAVSAAAVSQGLRDENADVRVAATELASERRLTDVVPDLTRLLSDPNSDVRQSAAEALTEMSGSPARSALRGALTHSDPEVRRIAVEYFGEESDK